MTERPRTKGRWLAIVATVLFAGPLVGKVGTVVKMIDAFEVLGESAGADPAELAGQISGALMFVAWGAGVGLIGTILVLVAFYKAGNREKWFFWWTLILSIVWCLTLFPYGLVIGLTVGSIFIANRDCFRPEHFVANIEENE